jgi:hypothetical protein
MGHAIANVETKIRETEQRLNTPIKGVRTELHESEAKRRFASAH